MSRRNKLISGQTGQSAFIVSIYGTRLSYEKFNREFSKACETVCGKHLTLHALRHTHTSLMAAQGISFEALQHRLGHSSSKITREIYAHVTKDAQKAWETQIAAVNLL